MWGEGSPARQIVGADELRYADQSHVQVATSAQTFGQMYRFLTGSEPPTTDVIPERPGRVRISGEANLFPSNAGAAGVTVEIWRVEAATGERRGDGSQATFIVGADGAWGPVAVNGPQALRDRAHPGRRLGPPLLLLAVPAQRPLRPAADLRAGDRIDLIRDQSDHHTSLTVEPLQGGGVTRAPATTCCRSRAPTS